MTIFGGEWVIEDFTNEIDNCITASTETPDDLKFVCRFLTMWDEERRGDELDELSLEVTTFTDEVSRSENVVTGGRNGGGGSIYVLIDVHFWGRAYWERMGGRGRDWRGNISG
jgi:hypothetical protein